MDNHNFDWFCSQLDLDLQTANRFSAFVESLLHWQEHKNLIANSTIDQIWYRHIYDSAQFIPLLPNMSGAVIDLGSGAGFPGIVLAILGIPEVHLVESNQTKARFLRETVEMLNLPVTIHCERIESLSKSLPSHLKIRTITARALAPLPNLIGLISSFAPKNTVSLLAKGRNWQNEIILAQEKWQFSYKTHQSKTDSESAIIELSEYHPKYAEVIHKNQNYRHSQSKGRSR